MQVSTRNGVRSVFKSSIRKNGLAPGSLELSKNTCSLRVAIALGFEPLTSKLSALDLR